MKTSKLVVLAVTVGVALSFSAVGCKKKPVRTTPLPGQGATVGNQGPGMERPGRGIEAPAAPDIKPIEVPSSENLKPDKDGITSLSTNDIMGWPQDRETFKQDTVFFDFDRAVVRADQASKVEAVATAFKAMTGGQNLLIEGHCDERGTVEYNRALGERRALSIREMLIKLGVDAVKVHTVSFGEDKPADPGHSEAAYSKNRRGEFVVATPPK